MVQEVLLKTIKTMAKYLKRSARLHITGKDGYKAFALIGLPNIDGDSCVALIRETEKSIRRRLLYYGSFTEKDLDAIASLDLGGQYMADKYSMIIRLS